MTDKTERAQIVAWLRLPRKARHATFGVRIGLAIMGLFRPNTLVEWMNDATADLIEDRDHLPAQGDE